MQDPAGRHSVNQPAVNQPAVNQPAVSQPATDRQRREQVQVAHLTLSHRPHDVRVFEKECRTLAQAGYRVNLAVPNAIDGSVAYDITLHDIAISVINDDAHALRRWRSRLAKTKAVATRLEAQIYHLHDPELIPLGLALKRQGARVIYDAHEDAPMEAWSLNRGRSVKRAVLPVLWWSLLAIAKQRFDLFVAATPEIARRFPPQRTLLVRNYPRLEMFPTLVELTEFPDRQSGPLVFPGLLSETRGAIEMLDALAATSRHPQLQLTLYGQILPAELEARMRAHRAWSRVHYRGHRPWREVLHAYGRCTAGLLLYQQTPEQRHAMPVKLFEFLLAGVPVIATDMPFWRQLVDGNPAVIFVDSTRPNEVAAAIQRLADDPSAARSIGLAGAAHARQRFDWAAEGAQLVSAYDRLCALK